MRAALALVMLLPLVAACTPPRVGPLAGAPTPLGLPKAQLPRGHQTIVFRWNYRDRIFSANGDGVARVASPDSLRLDFFADGGLAGGFAIVLGDSVYTPAGDQARRYLPPVPLLWAAFGALRLVGQDTIIRVDGDTLRADIVGDSASSGSRLPQSFWRVAFVDRQLVRLDRVAEGRLAESVQRRDSMTVSYRNNSGGRSLGLAVQRVTRGVAFDAAIWQR
ncbi:MAG: hypothetical protein ACT4R6_07490 [Gemmatimonadaceae bacterium]